MAFRIQESVVRGEIDHRVKGIVRGRIWVAGRTEPVMLELQGNAHPDFAGCPFTFTKPLKLLPQPGLAAAPQKLRLESMRAAARQELFEIREGILTLMDEFRGRK